MQASAEILRTEKWYNRYNFPLLPLLTIKNADEYNTSRFSFKWLFFTVWSLDAFQFEVSLTADTHWGLGIKGLLPYLRWVIAIPCPPRLGVLIDKYLSRKP